MVSACGQRRIRAALGGMTIAILIAEPVGFTVAILVEDLAWLTGDAALMEITVAVTVHIAELVQPTSVSLLTRS